MSHDEVIIITGANGFIGARLCSHFSSMGYKVIALVRNPGSYKDSLSIQYEKLVIPGDLDSRIFDNKISWIIHTAYDTRFKNYKSAYETNIVGSLNLFKQIKENTDAKILFISSMSAHAGALSFYGKSKYEIEKNLDLAVDSIIKPGFVIGAGGIFRRLAEMILLTPVIPVFYPNRIIQTLLIDDLILAIDAIIKNELSGSFLVSEEKGIGIEEFYRLIAKHLYVKRFFLPMPGNVALGLLKILEAMRVPLPFSSENLLGLKGLRKFDVKDSLRELKIQPSATQVSLEKLNLVKTLC